MVLVPEIIIILLLILVNGILSMTETAFVSARKTRLQQRAKDGDARSRYALTLANNPNQVPGTVELGMALINTLTGVFSGAMIAQWIAQSLRLIPWLAPYSDTISLSLVVLIITYLSLVIGELVPKRLALDNPERVAAVTEGAMRRLSTFAAPFVSFLSFSTEGVLRLIGWHPSTEPPVSEEEVHILIEQAIQRHALADYCHGRANIKAISHHKFVVLAQQNEPLAVWTGSTNFTDGAIYGQANVGHAIEEKALATTFLQLHQRLMQDPDITTSRSLTEELSPVPPHADPAPHYPIFSPRSTVIALDACANLIHNAQQLVCFTAPFGLDRRINDVLDDAHHQFLAFGLLNKADNTMEAMRRTAADRFVAPARIATPLDPFQVESLHHQGVYIHTKFIVIDPFSVHPTLVTGSANFSRNSSLNNCPSEILQGGYTLSCIPTFSDLIAALRVKRGLKVHVPTIV